MDSLKIIQKFIEPLNELNIEYVITGSVASIVYGNPRLTHDIDLVVNINKNQVEIFLSKFDPDMFYLPPSDIFQIELKRDSHGHVNIIHLESGFKSDIYFIGNSDLQRWALENFIEIEFFDMNLRLAPIEYIIVNKLIFYKDAKMQKHILDIQGILENSEAMINFSILNSFIKKYKVEDIWDSVKVLPRGISD